GQVAHDDAATEGTPALVVGVGHAVVADVGVGEGDDLAGVGRVGDDLLIAGQHGVEDDLTRGDAVRRHRTDGTTFKGGAVGEHEQGVLPPLAHRWASASITTGSPRSSVWRTRPVSLRPA